MYELALKAAKGGLSLTIEGETGVGKGTLATYISNTLFPDSPFVQVNCGAIVESLAQAELFGYQTGSFTHATDSRKGKLVLADKGILFLDEVTNLSPQVQEILLTVLEQKKVCAIGSESETPVEFYLITASNRPLQSAVAEKSFRSDLFYRIGQFSVTLPSLRGHPELIKAYLDHYGTTYNQHYQTDCHISAELESILMRHEWKGNVRELKHEIQNMVALHSQGDKSYMVEKAKLWTLGASQPLTDRLEFIEKDELKTVMHRSKNNLAKAARRLNIPRSTLQGKLKKYALYPVPKKGQDQE